MSDYPTKRRHTRFVVGGKVRGRVTATYEAVLVNISLGGALIEHAHMVRPGTATHLVLTVGSKTISIPCKVVRSVARRTTVRPDGEREMIYQTGLQFSAVKDEDLHGLNELIESIKGGSQSSSVLSRDTSTDVD